MEVPIPPMLKYSIVYNLLNFPPILIKFVSKFIVCKVLYFKAQYLLRLRSPLRKMAENIPFVSSPFEVDKYGICWSFHTKKEKKRKKDYFVIILIYYTKLFNWFFHRIHVLYSLYHCCTIFGILIIVNRT